MKRTTLTVERKEIHNAQESKWYNGSKGYCRSWPYRVRMYLNPDLSQQIQTEVKEKCDEWIAKLDSIKPSKRFIENNTWCADLRPQWCCVDSFKENAIPTEILHKNVYVKILDSYRKKNGQMGIEVMSRPRLEVSRYINSPRVKNYHNIGELLNFEICWDETKQLYYVNVYHRAENKPIDITRKNWGRTAKRKEFMHEIEKLEESLTKAGVTILRLNKTPNYKRGLENMIIECEGPEISE